MKIGKKTKITRELTRQETNRRNNIKRITISAVVAFAAYLALIVIENNILNIEEEKEAYQVSKDIPENTKLTEDNIDKYLRKTSVKLSLVPDGCITSEEDILNKFTTREYISKEIITEYGVSDKEENYTNGIENPVEISFTVNDLDASVSGKVREGDFINIYGLKQTDGNKIDTIYKHVYIEKAYDSSGLRIEDSADEEAEALLFTVILEESDVEQFNLMLENCEIKIVRLLYDTDGIYKVVNSNNISSSDTKEIDKSYDYASDDTDSIYIAE